MSARNEILKSYAEWTSLSALRIGAPIRAKADIYPLINKIDFNPVLDANLGAITVIEFEEWHKKAVDDAINANIKMHNHFGWAAKILNIYLKTYCYVGDGGRNNIRSCLHPPIDTGLWKGVKQKFKSNKIIISDTHSTTTISAIDTHEKYLRLIKGFRSAAETLNCSLIEIEQLWKGGNNI